MVDIRFPDVIIPAFKITRGKLLDITLLGVGLVIPPCDITFWEATKIMNGFSLLHTETIVDPIVADLSSVISVVPKAVWDLFRAKLDEMAADYYERHKTTE